MEMHYDIETFTIKIKDTKTKFVIDDGLNQEQPSITISNFDSLPKETQNSIIEDEIVSYVDFITVSSSIKEIKFLFNNESDMQVFLLRWGDLNGYCNKSYNQWYRI